MNQKNQENPTVRTRFAPSPTGYIHVGNVRSALYPFLLAEQARRRGAADSRFVLRIEDTDQQRFVAGAEELIVETLRWLGLDWDEGPRANSSVARESEPVIRENSDGEKVAEIGEFGPYHQTARREIYYKYARKLLAKNLAYADPTPSAEIQAYHDECDKNGWPFLFRNIRPENPPAWTPDCGLPLRFRVTELKKYHWHDEVFGELSAGAEVLDDFVLIKSDGLPTYNFAHIVDDFEMKITHVIRGQEYISSMPRYLSLYDALEIPYPIFACLPHILRPDGKKKLGKRDGAKSVEEYRADGILPEAMLNFLALLGWRGDGETEIYSKEDLIAKFDLAKVQRSGARFDEKKLIWLNGQWIRRISLEDLFARCEDFWGENAKNATEIARKNVLAVVKDRLKTLRDLPALTEYFFARPEPNWAMITENKQLKKFARTELVALLAVAGKSLAALSDEDFCDEEKTRAALNDLLATTGTKPAILFSIIRLALTWAPFSPGLPETFAVLGRAESLARIERARDAA